MTATAEPDLRAAHDPTSPFGTRRLRSEDPPLLTGESRFVDAVADLGIHDIDTPASPWRVWAAVRPAGGERAASSEGSTRRPTGSGGTAAGAHHIPSGSPTTEADQ